MATPLLVGGAVAGTQDEILRPIVYQTPSELQVVVRPPAPVHLAVKLRQPLKLPNIAARTRKLESANRVWLAPQITRSKHIVRFFTNPKHHWMVASQKTKCWQVAWQRECTIARAKLRLHRALVDVAENRLYHELPETGDWQTAIRIAQRVYPGTADWMLYISDREGGWSTWVWYGGRPWEGYHIGNDYLGADTVGGWMQFRFSTFAPYYRGMVKDLAQRGFQLPQFPDRGGPAEYQPWLDPLGQALTAGYMRYTGRDGCHWCL